MASTLLNDCGCSGSSFRETGEPAGLERTRYFPRQLIGPDDLTQDQLYVRERLRRHNRLLHGWGVVCGLGVRSAEGCRLEVEPGAALDACGDEIVVPATVTVDVCRETIDGTGFSSCAGADPWCGDVRVPRSREQPYYLAIRYRECHTRPVLAPSDGCGCEDGGCEYSRIRDGFELKVLDALPESHRRMPGPRERLQATECTGERRPCPDEPSDRWVVLADLLVDEAAQSVQANCFPHRRHVVAFGNWAFVCDDGRTFSGVRELVVDESFARSLAPGDEPGPARASVVVRLPGGALASFPGHFEVEPGETYAALLAREGDRRYAVGGETFTLADALAIAGVDPARTVESTADALRPLEGRDLRFGDLAVVRTALAEVLDDEGFARLTEHHAGAPERAVELPAADLKGVAPASALGRRLAGLSVGDIAADDSDAFVTTMLRGTRREGRDALERQARQVWETARRASRLAETWTA